MITSILAAERASLTASSGSPQQNPSTAASICAWVPVSVSVTTLTWGNPATCPRASFGPPSRRRFASVSGASRTKPSTAASRIPR
jgi:hypothetical protein